MTTSITKAIVHEETKLARLDDERKNILENIKNLRALLATSEAESQSSTHSNLSPEAKITLFRSLFKGREDVYPKMWVSKNGDRKGYMPACGNGGNYSLCGKRKIPRVKCSDCTRSLCLSTSPIQIDVQSIFYYISSQKSNS